MEVTSIVLLALTVLLVLIVMRIPIALALLMSGVVGLFFLRDIGYALETASRIAYSTPARNALIVIPLFIAMGIFAKRGTFAEDAFDIAQRLLRKIRGGLAMATVLTCAGFAAVSGSSVATVAAIGPLAIREMGRHRYSLTLAAGIVGAAGTLGVLIPPSVALVLYGIMTGESIGVLLIAGIVPGILSAIMYFGVIQLWGFRYPDLVGASNHNETANSSNNPKAMNHANAIDEPTEAGSGEVTPAWGKLTYTVARIVMIFSVVVGGIYLGIVTPTQAAGLGAIVALLFFAVDLVRGRSGYWKPVKLAILESVSLTSMVFALLIGASVFSFFLVLAGVPSALTEWVVELPIPNALIVILILLAFIPLGMFLDPISMLLIAAPLVHPVVTGMGYEGIWFAILVVKMMEIGLITPPFGLNAFVVAGASKDISVERAFRGILWFLPVDIVTVLILFLFPSLVLWLPSLM